jgi:hypothetical protein
VPFTAPGAKDKAFWNPVLLSAAKVLRLLWRRLPPSLGEISEEIPRLFKRINVPFE